MSLKMATQGQNIAYEMSCFIHPAYKKIITEVLHPSCPIETTGSILIPWEEIWAHSLTLFLAKKEL